MSALTRQQAIERLTAPGEPYELDTVTIGGRVLRVYRNAPPTLRELFAQTASELPFLQYEDERLSFAQAWAEAGRIARLLRDEYAVVKGDRVAISMRNYPEWILCFTAITSIGAIAVGMNAWWTPEEMAFGLSDSGAKVLFADTERLERLARCPGPIAARAIAVRPASHALPDGVRELRALLAPMTESAMPAVELAPDDPATLFYTSGSAGHPKGALSTHRAIVSALLSWELEGRIVATMTGVEPPAPPQQPGTLMAVPLFHVTGSHAVYLMSYRMQRRLVCLYKWDVALAADLIERERLNSFTGPPAMTGDLVRVARETGRDLGTLVSVGGGGASRAPEQVRQIDASFARAQPSTGWGMTETNALGTWIGGEDYLRRPASSGRAAALMELRVVAPDGAVLPANERGELQVRGTGMFQGYWNRPDANRQAFDGDWFRTGDVAYLDDEGYLFIVDRIKDLIIRGGENIGCGQVEYALQMYPGVQEAVVYAVPDERLGEEVGATIYASRPIDVDALRAFLKDHLAAFEIPRHVRVVHQPLPRTASGKLLKREVRGEAIARLGGAAAGQAGSGR